MSTVRADQAAIESHYDVGVDFYRLWLDRSLTYSCALWPAGLDDDLDTAQRAKVDHHLDHAGVGEGSRVLDVGCGWGATLAAAVERRGAVEAVGLTLSADQCAWVRKQAPSGVEVVLGDWATFEPEGPFDAIVSIGAFEHFAPRRLPPDARLAIYEAFFARCHAWTRRGARMSLQTIAAEDRLDSDGPVARFFEDEVFPQSGVPTLTDVVRAAEPWFRVKAVRNDGDHYAHTLRLWSQRLAATEAEARAVVGDATYEHYQRYLKVSRVLFRTRTTTLLRVALERRDEPRDAAPGVGAAGGAAARQP